jgi:hypothetical protein
MNIDSCEYGARVKRSTDNSVTTHLACWLQPSQPPRSTLIESQS